jgi:cell division initiation protein
LEIVSETLECHIKENKKMQEYISRLKAANYEYKKREDTFKKAIINSQKVLDMMKTNAQKSSELIIAEAEVNAEKILNNAHKRLAQLHEDISELKRQRMQLEVQFRSILETHSKMLDISQEQAKRDDNNDNKVKIFNKA